MEAFVLVLHKGQFETLPEKTIRNSISYHTSTFWENNHTQQGMMKGSLVDPYPTFSEHSETETQQPNDKKHSCHLCLEIWHIYKQHKLSDPNAYTKWLDGNM